MIGSGQGNRPLVADRRYPPQAAARKPAGGGSGSSSAGGRGGKSGGGAGGGSGRGSGGKGASGGGSNGGGRKPARRKRSGNPVANFFAGLFRMILRAIWAVVWRVGLIGAMILGGIVFYFYSQLPPVTDLLDGRARGSVTLLDNQGQVFAWRGETFGGNITSDHVSANLRNAVVATEDKRFYHHFGVSPRGIISAVRINLTEGRGALEGNGGSTITQQVAKLLCLGVAYDSTAWKSEAEYEADCRKGGIWRKIKEVPYAMAMEAKYSKADILTIYFNRAYLGAGARGFEAAAQRYFGKSAANVTPAEAAMLAGLLKAPSYYAPTGNLKRAQDRANVIIGLMQEQGYLTAAQADEARAHPAQLSEAAQTKSGGFFADWVMESGPGFLTKDTTEDVIIRTTLDQRMQKAAETGLAYVFDNKIKSGSKAQAAIVVMSADGAVRAMVGGRKIEAAGSFNRATQALRQTGSAFKPFVYAAALDLGWSPSDYVEDTPMTLNIKGSGPWTPQNYDRKFEGVITLTQALRESRNIPAVRVSEAVGRKLVRKVASEFGVAQQMADGPALALGASESTLIDMTGAYAGILNGGSSVKPYGMVEVRLQGDSEPLFGQEGGIGERVVSERAAQLLTYMMNQVIEKGTGSRARLKGRPAAGKTGTTQAARDAWFVGFTADYVVGVWMGYDDNTPLSGVTGGGLPAEIWHEVMVRVNEGVPVRDLPMIIPEPKTPPSGVQNVDPNMEPGRQPGGEAPYDPQAAEGAGQPQPMPPEQPRQSGDPVEAILRDLLGVN